jgi:hypothetical protein
MGRVEVQYIEVVQSWACILCFVGCHLERGMDRITEDQLGDMHVETSIGSLSGEFALVALRNLDFFE